MRPVTRREFLRACCYLFGAVFASKLSSGELGSLARMAQALESSGPESVPNSAPASDPGNFRFIYLNPKLRDSFYPFLKNVFHLYPEDDFHRLISEISSQYSTDQEIYEKIHGALPKIKPFLASLRYSLPALKKQKQEMARQTMQLLGPVDSVKGYVEIGTTGRYISEIRKSLKVKGSLYLVNDVHPSYAPVDMVERGQMLEYGSFIPLNDYGAWPSEKIPDESIDLVTNFIGFHHSPADRLDGFVRSITRVLKPGGRLIVRDHNVDSPEMNRMVALAHDVFNVGLDISWQLNHEQIRNFWSVAQMSSYLRERGFREEGTQLLQEGDPTRNTLMKFVKT
jgi:SAM-dependent methyltransferase